ncbi:MAG TPA: 3-hydroxyacyl-CoA dehydrogenase family protein [Actinophytocola sp.]|uniref:3-hydroxyacyl-CoA dehydrogenase family protein n=1 Tax=Actinophytocola sp. TaxID=1872138 RepID=UPI002DDCB139|nr:3-hydroxyacyl-CoA dehydrogenase family protein [Actinophytocola sp.]HEV2779523.1 3-hydroxyacyl-CoA dehydrogenase family protein [Actinophytocola sp.]
MTLVGVVGAGIMGAGVAQSLAQSGHAVRLVDISADALRTALDSIELNCRMSRMLGGPAVDAGEVLDRITTGTDLELLADTEVVIENITEDEALKRDLYPRLDRICQPGCVLVANTSAIPITRIASWTGRPAQVAGVHFMNPVPMKPAVEFIPGHHTSPEAQRTVRELLESMGKKPIDVNDACGFISNRISHVFMNEAAYLVYEGVASAETIDEVFRSCFGHPMGPLQTLDLIGVDTVLQSIEVLYQHFADSKYRPCPLLKQMVDAGLLGRKSGEGFYRHGPDSRGPADSAGRNGHLTAVRSATDH